MNPRRIFADVKLQTKMWYRVKNRAFIEIAFPALFMVVLGLFFSGPGQMQMSDLHVVDMDQSLESERLIEAIMNTSMVNVVLLDNPPLKEDAARVLQENKWAGILWIPDDFAENLAKDEQNMSHVELFIDPTRLPDAAMIDMGFQTQVAQETLRIMGTRPAFGVDRVTVANPAILGVDDRVPYRDFLFTGFMGIIIAAVSLFGTASAALLFRGTNMLKKLGTTPLEKHEWLVSKMLVAMLIALLSSIFLMVIAIVAFDTKLHFTPLAFAVIASGSLFFTSLGLFLTGVFKEPATVTLAANAIYMPMIFLSGTIIRLSQLPDAVEFVAKSFPMTHFTTALRGAMLLDDPGTAVVGLVYLLAGSAVFVFIGAKTADWSE